MSTGVPSVRKKKTQFRTEREFKRVASAYPILELANRINFSDELGSPTSNESELLNSSLEESLKTNFK